MAEREHHAIAAAVWVGSLVVVGAPTIALVSTTRNAALSALDVGLTDWLALAIGIVELAIGAFVATEVARVRLHGYRELHRGSDARILLRHAILAAPAISFLGLAGAFVVGEMAAETDGLTDPVGIVAFGAVSLVFAYAIARTVRSFVAGRRETLAVGHDAPGHE